MKTAVCIITLIYGLLSIAAPLSQIRDRAKRFPSLVMLCGGVLLFTAAILELLVLPGTVLASAAGALAVCIAAVINGRRSGSLHIRHHLVRFLISCILIAGLWLY